MSDLWPEEWVKEAKAKRKGLDMKLSDEFKNVRSGIKQITTGKLADMCIARDLMITNGEASWATRDINDQLEALFAEFLDRAYQLGMSDSDNWQAGYEKGYASGEKAGRIDDKSIRKAVREALLEDAVGFMELCGDQGIYDIESRVLHALKNDTSEDK